MPATFSASTCISTNNTSPGPFNIYLDNSYSTPFSSATLNQLINCPFVIVVPTGTTTLYFKDTIKNFCFTTSIQDNNICSNCKLGLSNYSATTTSRLYCGFLTGSCQNITDYVIHWYGPNDTTTLVKRTGFGSVFSGEYDIQHPFLGTSSIPLSEGIYTPVIQKVIVSGLTFSNTGGTGNVLFSGSCLPTTTIQPLTCLNNTNTNTKYWLSGYNHNLNFNSVSQGTPQPVSATYVISANTKFMAWRFKGNSVPDTFKLSFSGSNYTSARLLSKGKFSFKYGKVDISAKLPAGGGTWPALWMLGDNIGSAGWPACGEIDIMEYVGKQPGKIHTTLHTPESFGQSFNTKTTTIDSIEDGFHIYKTIWSPSQIQFFIDNLLVYTFSPEIKDDITWPFNKPFYIILNLAVGGNFGGSEVDESIFPEDFIIDYVKVFQQFKY